MGNWLTVNGESVYGAGAFDLPKNQHDWGKITCKKNEEKTTLYFHVFNWPLNKKLFVTGISSKPEKIWLLSDKEKNSLRFTHKGAYTEIELPNEQPDQLISVIAAEYDSNPEIPEGLVAKNKSGGYSFLHGNQIVPVNPENLVKKEKYGTIPEYLLIEKPETFTWKIFVDTPGRKRFDISYSYQNNSNSAPEIILETANQKITVFAKPTGKTVGEPNNNWIIDNFTSNRIAEINFPEAGFYVIKMQIIPSKNDSLKFQWIWAK
jgi:alpha-L-fucosidase